MTKQYTLRAMALAGVCLTPLAAAAQDFDLGGAGSAPDAASAKEYNNEIDVGVRYQSSTSPLYGRYNGHDSKGFGSTGGFQLQGGDAPESGGTLFFKATGKNLDFQPDHQGPNNSLAPESEVSVSAGQQGTWKANAYYDAITYTGQNFTSPYSASGSLAPGLVPFGGATATTAGAIGSTYYVTHRLPMLQETTGTRRDIGGANGKYIIGDWTVGTALRHEHKEGTVLQTMDTAYGGVAFPEPVNYDTDRYDVTAAYATRKLQTQIGYTYSKFTDNNWAFNAPYFTTGAASTANQLSAQYLLPPSNDAHYVLGTAGYNLMPGTRVTGTFRVGVEMSNSSLGTGTATSGGSLASAYNYSYLLKNPATSDQLARVYNGRLQATSRPLSNLDLKAAYSIDGRDVGSSPTSLYEAGHGEGGASTTTNTIVNQSLTKQKAELEAGYRIIPSTKVTLGYAYGDTHRNAGNAVGGQDSVGYWVGHSVESTMTAKVASNIVPDVTTALTYEHAVRSGHYEYVTEPESGAFYQTPRTADRVKLRGDYAPNELFTVGVNSKLEANHYHYLEGQTGTNSDYNASIGPDLTYSPTKLVALHAFYTYQEIYYSNGGNGCAGGGSVAGTTATATTCANGQTKAIAANGYGYNSTTTDSVHTVGLSADWKPIERLKLGVEYTFSYGDIGYNLYDGITTTTTAYSWENVQNLPNITSSMHSFKLRGEYELASNISLMAGYGFDMYKDNDWAYGWNPVVLANTTIGGGTAYSSVSTLTSGESQNSYRVHSLYTGVRVKF
ncbi:MtrB/PioB family decaheme-associated outer membrane protein [Telmatospirillum sp.]|uniref:MtrB/PioB family decaheme-associated outer membrane protein n=1 Tax=Telmatospirillum sp. TaxID=2079197 RepID=UPI0028413C29|nr:MtrB/PioB family decaheme-associated outer membrane protein [Telmatospirillum sp.]MDR3437112.1 MtrB/PioB family decaheme-associated outer membrane protein [Telmatospirillum sp.]